MSKKNKSEDYSIATQDIQKFFAILVQVVGVGVVLLNVWIVSKLAPVAQDLAVLATRVDAIETGQSSYVTENNFTFVTNRLDRLEVKIDRLLEYGNN